MFWSGIITRGLFKRTKRISSHNKAYVISSDYKGRGNLGYLTALPATANTNQRKNQIVNYLTLPDPSILGHSFVSTNESVLEPQRAPLEIHTIRGESTVNDSDSRIEVTTYFYGAEEDVERMGINNSSTEEVLQPILESPPTTAPELKDNDVSVEVEADQLPTPGNENEGDDNDTTPIPPKRQKRRNKTKGSSTEKAHLSEADLAGNTTAPPHKRRSEPANESGHGKGEAVQRRGATVMYHGNVGEHQVPRQRKVSEPLQVPFEITNPMYLKEE